MIWLVVIAMAVRNSLMNAGNPIFSAFAMEHVAPAERATLAAAMTVLWQIGWVIGATWYAAFQALLGFDGGYTVNFVTIIAPYSLATALYWRWFRSILIGARHGARPRPEHGARGPPRPGRIPGQARPSSGSRVH